MVGAGEFKSKSSGNEDDDEEEGDVAEDAVEEFLSKEEEEEEEEVEWKVAEEIIGDAKENVGGHFWRFITGCVGENALISSMLSKAGGRLVADNWGDWEDNKLNSDCWKTSLLYPCDTTGIHDSAQVCSLMMNVDAVM